MGIFLQDLRYASRNLVKRPGFTAVVVITLALGIGANTAIFSLLDAVLLQMLPVESPKQLLELNRTTSQGLSTGFSYPAFQRFQDQNHVFSGVLAVSKTPLHTTDDPSGQPAQGHYVSGNFFSLLGVRTQVGRAISINDDSRLTDNNVMVAVISDRYWRRRFAGDSTIVGKPLAVEGKPFTIIGVTVPEFFGLQVGAAPDFWVPLAAEPTIRARSWLTQPDFGWLSIVGRLKPGNSHEQARADLNVIFSQLLTELVARISGEQARQQLLLQKIQVISASSGLSRLRLQYSKPLFILMTIVALVLLIACANIANLLSARSATRRREFSVRLAIGASRFRLIRQLLTEAFLLSCMGGIAGLLCALWASNFLVKMMSPDHAPIHLQIELNTAVFVFVALVSMFTTLLVGVLPAFRATRIAINSAFKESSTTSSVTRSSAMLGKALVVSQVALSLVLVCAAGLFVRSLRNLYTLEAGFNRDNVLVAGVNPVKVGYKSDALPTFYRQVIEQTTGLPGVESVSLSQLTPISGAGITYQAEVEGSPAKPNEDIAVFVNSISPRYFETFGTRLLLGRDFNAQDGPGSLPVAIINETMMKHFFGGADPIGRRVRLGDGKFMTVIGVVKDAKYMTLREVIPRTIYKNFLQEESLSGSLTLAVRTTGRPESIVPALRKEISNVAASVTLDNPRTFASQVDQSLIQERLMASLSGFFGLLALLLVCVGLYGVMSFNVARRTTEIGIRMALGAHRANIIRMVLRECVWLLALGIGIGVPLAVGSTRLAANQISGLLFGLSPTDVSTLALCAVLLLAVAMLAAIIPARRAAKVDPLVALRDE